MRLSAQQYAHAWWESLHEAPQNEWDAISKRFLTYIHHNGDLKLLSEVGRIVAQMEQAATGTESVVVRSAHALDSDWVKKQVSTFVEHPSTTIEQVIDPELVGGVQIETPNKRWDLSLRGQLRALKQHLTN